MAKYTAIGGQALIEGILMKSPEKTAMAVRKKDGTIDISYPKYKSLREKYAFFRIPFIRGIVSYIESMIQGYKAMMDSMEISGFADLEDENTPQDKKMSKKKQNVIMAIITVFGTALGVVLAVALFMGIPWAAVKGIEYLADTTLPRATRALIENLIKLAVLVVYMWGVSFMKEMKRVFSYHGAEHKTIFCYEKGLELTVENVRKQSRFHPRCGTSFLIIMVLIGIVFSTLLQFAFPQLYNLGAAWVAAKILMLPLICAVGFEVLRICGRYDNLFTRIISAPGRWMQRITTKEPD
ncbi:MAG: DUF1385 domain-containing protein, partial [Clostridia bacterium]|nr:DUF1385 domain-containing protein [Clostridia bacterium]